MISIFYLFFLLFQFTRSQNVEVWLSDPTKNSWFSQQVPQSFAADTGSNPYTIFVREGIKYQTMDGFGASLTDASCWLIQNKLSASVRRDVLQRLFSTSGIGLSLLRQPIGASDFGWEAWSLADTPNNVDDWNLSSFSLWREDAYIRPILDQALNVNRERIKLMASPWSPPAWMKSGKNLFGASGGYLRPECYDVYADYFVKFVQEYERKGSPIYAITPQNEPEYAPNAYPGMLMSSTNQIGFIRDYLGPKFRNLSITTKIIGYDHNYDSSGYQYAVELLSNSGANQYIAGIGWHTYTSPSHQNMARIHDTFNKDVWITEAGSGTWIGSTANQFQDQMMHLIRSPRNWAKGVIFWNVALDQNAGPKLANVDTTNTNRGLITIRSDTMDSYSFESGYFSMGHSSRFVDPGAHRIDSNQFDNDIENVAYQNLYKTIVFVISNRKPNQRTIKVRWNFKSFQYILPGQAAVTFKWDGSSSDGSDNAGGGGTITPVNQIVALRSRINNKYVTVNAAGNLVASATTITNNEKFEIFPITSVQIAFKSVSKGKFVSADNSGNSPLIANRDSVLAWEAFEQINLADGTKGFKAIVNGKYVVAENAGNDPLIANRNSIAGAWEAFDMITV